MTWLCHEIKPRDGRDPDFSLLVSTDWFAARYPAGSVVLDCDSLATLEPHFPEFPSLHGSRLAGAVGDALLEIWKVAVQRRLYFLCVGPKFTLRHFFAGWASWAPGLLQLSPHLLLQRP